MRRGADYLRRYQPRRPHRVGRRPSGPRRHDGARDWRSCPDPRRDSTTRRLGGATWPTRGWGRVQRQWLAPRSSTDLAMRRRVHRHWTEGSFGLMGRTPDHVASLITAFAANPPRVRTGRAPVRRKHRGFLPAGPRQRLVPRLRRDAAAGRSLQTPAPTAGALPVSRASLRSEMTGSCCVALR